LPIFAPLQSALNASDWQQELCKHRSRLEQKKKKTRNSHSTKLPRKLERFHFFPPPPSKSGGNFFNPLLRDCFGVLCSTAILRLIFFFFFFFFGFAEGLRFLRAKTAKAEAALSP
jgi:hypothetical protein